MRGLSLARWGSSSYIHSVIERDKNANVGLMATSGADDTLEGRRYSCQNFGGGRADVVARLECDGDVSEWVGEVCRCQHGHQQIGSVLRSMHARTQGCMLQ